MRRKAAAEKSIAALTKEIARLERRFKDDTSRWQEERAAAKAGRNATIRRRKQELAAVRAYAALIPGALGVYKLYNNNGAEAGYHLGISSHVIYLFGKGWFHTTFVEQGGNGWGQTTPFGRPEKEAAE
jgi:hypothetical protein